MDRHTELHEENAALRRQLDQFRQLARLARVELQKLRPNGPSRAFGFTDETLRLIGDADALPQPDRPATPAEDVEATHRRANKPFGW